MLLKVYLAGFLLWKFKVLQRLPSSENWEEKIHNCLFESIKKFGMEATLYSRAAAELLLVSSRASLNKSLFFPMLNIHSNLRSLCRKKYIKNISKLNLSRQCYDWMARISHIHSAIKHMSWENAKHIRAVLSIISDLQHKILRAS